jgi:hypothetical protein
MQAIIAINFRISPPSPTLVSFRQCFSFWRNSEIYDGRSSASNGGFGPLIEIVDCECAHKGKLEVCVRVYAAWNDELSRAVDDLSIFMGDIFWNLGNFAIFDEEISDFCEIGVDDPCVFEEIAMVESLDVNAFRYNLIHNVFKTNILYVKQLYK